MLPVINVANGQLITGNIGIGNISSRMCSEQHSTRPSKCVVNAIFHTLANVYLHLDES